MRALRTVLGPTQRALLLALICGVAAIHSLSASAEETKKLTLDGAMTNLASKIAGLLDSKGTSLAVGGFEGPDITSTGPGIIRRLKEKLANKDITKVPVSIVEGSAAQLQVRGSYFYDSELRQGMIEAQLYSKLGKKLENTVTQVFVSDEAELRTLFGITGSHSGIDSSVKDALKEGLEKPSVTVAGSPGNPGATTIISADPKSPFAIEILVATPDGKVQPRAVANKDGLAFVDIKPGETYAIRLINNAEFDVGVSLAIDGLSSFTFTEIPAYRALDKWVIHRTSSGLIKGWHKTDQQQYEFNVTDYARSAAAQFGAKGAKLGTITAVFCAAWDPFGEKPPPDEQSVGRGEPAATAKGKPVLAEFAPVVRQFGAVRASISVRYAKPDPEDLPKEPAPPPATP